MRNPLLKARNSLTKVHGENNQDGIWINKIGKYYEMCNIYGDNDKLSVSKMYMDKTSCDWFL